MNIDDNPFVAPTAAGGDPPNEKLAGKTPFADKAVRFSLYAPVLLMATNLIVRSSLGVNHGGTKAFAFLSLLTIISAFFLGVLGLVGSLKRLAIWSAFLGLFGTLLNGAIVAAVVHAWR